jgi:hypothetical protein
VAASAPLRGRLVDRRGAGAAVPPFAVATAAALGCLPLAPEAGAGWLIVALAELAGLSVPPLVVGMRLEWQRLLGPGDARLAQAYALESAAKVALYIVGPLGAGAGIAVVGVAATLAASGALALVGFALQASGARHKPAERRGILGPLRFRGVLTLAFATALADAGLGAVDVAVAAFARQGGEAGAAGVLLAVFAASPVLGGVLLWRPLVGLAASPSPGADHGGISDRCRCRGTRRRAHRRPPRHDRGQARPLKARFGAAGSRGRLVRGGRS